LSKAKQKGTLAETAVADYLKTIWPAVERRAQSGKNDKGDIAGINKIVIEVKNQKSYKIHEWLKETEIEKSNAEADFGILLVKPNGLGVSKVDKWWAVIPLGDLVQLLQKAGYAQELQSQSDREHPNLPNLP
jgi:Holliday junction resolvase